MHNFFYQAEFRVTTQKLLGRMAARATCSASSNSDDTSALARHLLDLSHDELGVIVDGLANPLQPVIAVSLSSTCKGLWTPLQAALEVLRLRHERAVALCRKMNKRCSGLRETEKLIVRGSCILTAEDMATLGVLLTKWLPGLLKLRLENTSSPGVDTPHLQALSEGLGRGAAPSLRKLDLGNYQFGPAGSEALAAAFRRGALPKLETLLLNDNPLKDQGVSALAAPLRKLPALKKLVLYNCAVGDEGVASLVDGLAKDDFKALKKLELGCNRISNAGVAKLVAALDAGALPSLTYDPSIIYENPPGISAIGAISRAMKRRPRSDEFEAELAGMLRLVEGGFGEELEKEEQRRAKQVADGLQPTLW